MGLERAAFRSAAHNDSSGSLTRGNKVTMKNLLSKLWAEQQGQDVAEYSIMLAVILVIVVGTIHLIGSNAGNVFSNVGSSIQ